MQNMKNINPEKAIGYDNIPDKYIRVVYKELYVPICNLRNTCIATKTFPTPFEFADISRIFKSGDKMNKGNFYPVSIISILWKLNEGFLNDKMHYLSQCWPRSLSPYGFTRPQWVKYMEGSGYFSACDTSTLTNSNAVWTVFLCVLLWIGSFYPSFYVSIFYSTNVYLTTALYIFAPYSRILANVICLPCNFK